MNNNNNNNKNYKYITTTLPYINSTPHIGHCFEFVLADVISEFHRLNSTVFFNVGIDEHGQKVYAKAIEEGYSNTQDYCDALADKWKEFCSLLNISYDNFYRTTDAKHKEDVLKFYNEIKEQHIFSKKYTGNYCVGCEAYITEKEIGEGNKCQIHKTELISTEETNKFFNLSEFSDLIQDVLVDKSKSIELKNIIQDKFDLSITRQNVKWGIDTGDNDVFYVWFEALLNYIFAVKYYQDKEFFNSYWNNSLIICGKDNLKFQAYILQALLLSNNVPQTSQVLVHGNILDKDGIKLSKTIGNVIDPVKQVETYGVDAVRYYLVFGLNTFIDSKYSEQELVRKWNNEVVNGLGNLISRLLHLIELRGVVLDKNSLTEKCSNRIKTNSESLNNAFGLYDFKAVGVLLNEIVFSLNKAIVVEKPYDKSSSNYAEVLNDLYFELKELIPYYGIVLKEHKHKLEEAFEVNKKTILFEKIG